MNAFAESLSHPLAERIGWGLIHFLWQGAIVAALAAIALWLLRRCSANARYVTSYMAMIVMAVSLPVTIGLLPMTPSMGDSLATADSIAPSNRAKADAPQSATSFGMPVFVDQPRNPAYAEPSNPSRWSSLASAFAYGSILPWMQLVLPWVVCGWLIGILALSTWRASALIAIRRLTNSGTHPVHQSVRDSLLRMTQRLKIHRTIQVMESTRVVVPSVCGLFRPVILLPGSILTGLTPKELEAILAHELAHIRRHDYLLNLLQTAIETLLFYHPAVWWVSGRIRVERENCCDDLALWATGDRLKYARSLTKLEEICQGEAALATVPLLAATGGSLLLRVQRILGATHRRTIPQHFASAGGSCLAGALLMVSVVGLFALGGEPARIRPVVVDKVKTKVPAAKVKTKASPDKATIEASSESKISGETTKRETEITQPETTKLETTKHEYTQLDGIHVLHSIPLASFEPGATIPLGQGDHRFDDIPEFLLNRQYTRREGYQGILRFRVSRSQNVVMALYGADWGGGGDNRGGWKEEVISKDQLKQQGWKEIAKIIGHHTVYKVQQTPWIVFSRDCQAGETFAIRNHKYQAPVLFSAKRPNAQPQKVADNSERKTVVLPGPWGPLVGGLRCRITELSLAKRRFTIELQNKSVQAITVLTAPKSGYVDSILLEWAFYNEDQAPKWDKILFAQSEPAMPDRVVLKPGESIYRSSGIVRTSSGTRLKIRYTTTWAGFSYARTDTVVESGPIRLSRFEEDKPRSKSSSEDHLRSQIEGLLEEAKALHKAGRIEEARQHEEKAEYRRRQFKEHQQTKTST